MHRRPRLPVLAAVGGPNAKALPNTLSQPPASLLLPRSPCTQSMWATLSGRTVARHDCGSELAQSETDHAWTVAVGGMVNAQPTTLRFRGSDGGIRCWPWSLRGTNVQATALAAAPTASVRGQSRANAIGTGLPTLGLGAVVATSRAVSLCTTGCDTHASGVAEVQPDGVSSCCWSCTSSSLFHAASSAHSYTHASDVAVIFRKYPGSPSRL